MENYGDAMKYAQTSANSAGTAWEKYSTSYLNSIEAKTNALTAQFESLSQSVLDSDLVKGFVDLMTNVVKALESILGVGDGVLLKITLFIASMAALYIALTSATAGIHKLNLKLLATRVCIARAAKQTSVFNATLSTLNINPVILAITAVTAVVVGLGVAFEAAEKKARENFEKTINNIEKSAEAISKFDDEIESLESLQSKLVDAQGDHKKLANIYDELNSKVGTSINLLNGEAAAYEAVSLKLKDQILATKKLRDEEFKEKLEQAKNGFNTQKAKRKSNFLWFTIDPFAPDATGDMMRSLVRNEGEVWSDKTYSQLLSHIYGGANGSIDPRSIEGILNYDILYENFDDAKRAEVLKNMGFSADDWDSYWNNQVNIANEVFSEYIGSSDPMIKRLLEGAVDRLIRGGFDLNETEEAIRELYASADVVQEYYDALASGDGAKEAYNRLINEFNTLIGKYPELEDKIESFVAAISTANSDVNDSVKLRLNSVSEIIGSIKDKYDLLSSAVSDMDSYGVISADNITKLLDEYPALERYVTKTVHGYTIGINAVDKFSDALLDEYRAIVEAKKGTEDYQVAKENLYNLEVALATLRANKRNEETEDVGSVDSLLDRLHKVEKEYGAYKSAVDDMGEYGSLQSDTLASLLEAFPDLEKRLSSTASGYVVATDSAEKYLSAQEELLKQELRQASTVEDRRVAARKLTEFMAIKATIEFTETIERQTEAIEEQKKVLEDRRDELDDDLKTYRDIVDERKKLLTTFKKEIDYRDELSKKQSNVADLETRLAVARLDKSEQGRANVRELESELLNVRDELEDFMLDHAIEQVTTDLDEEYSLYEKMVNSEITRITDEIASLDRDIVEIATEIRNKMDGIGDIPLRPNLSNNGSGSVSIYHDGGTVGDGVHISRNEEFAKLMDGEFVSTPVQVERFVNKTLPALMSNSSRCGNNYNAPLVSVVCDTITREVMPDLTGIINAAANEVKRQLDDGVKRSGRGRPVGQFLH